MRRLLAVSLAVLALLAAPALAQASAGASVLADEVVAVVDTQAILLSELEVEARLERAIDEGGGTLQMPLSQAELKAALSALIDRLVVYEQAERLQVFPLGAREVAAALTALREQLGARELDRFVAAFDVDDATLAAIVGRNVRVQRYLEGRFRLASRPREAAVRAYYGAHHDEFEGRSFAGAAPEIRARLARRKFERLSRAFVQDVRQRARVRLLRDLDQPGLETVRSGTVSAAQAGRVKGGQRP